jgi:hypothetical protein
MTPVRIHPRAEKGFDLACSYSDPGFILAELDKPTVIFPRYRRQMVESSHRRTTEAALRPPGEALVALLEAGVRGEPGVL